VKQRQPNLLERKLTRRMIQVQTIALVLFFGLGLFPILVLPTLRFLGDSQPLDPTTTRIFAKSLVEIDGDAINFTTTPELQRLLDENPKIWFYARTLAGQSAELGAVPPLYREHVGDLWALEMLEVRMADGGEGAVLVRPEQSAVGMVRVMTGDGPVIGVAKVITHIYSLIVIGTTGLLFLASIIAIPRVVRWEMRGLKTSAEQAKLIDINTRGTRLATEEVPEEVRALVNAVNDGLSRLDESYDKRERFLADSAHELRTPIAILQTRIETADPFPEQARLLVDVARLSSLADQLLDLQRMDLGNSAFAPLDLVDLADMVVGDLAPLAIAAGYELSLIAPDRPVLVNGDSGSLVRALTNVVQNAIAYGGQRGEITVEVGREGTLTITDEGPGVPKIERDRVFEPFYRVKPSARGAGLGLNLVDTIVRRHNGHITIADAITGGACFVITLPLIEADVKKTS